MKLNYLEMAAVLGMMEMAEMVKMVGRTEMAGIAGMAGTVGMTKMAGIARMAGTFEKAAMVDSTTNKIFKDTATKCKYIKFVLQNLKSLKSRV